MEPVDDAGDAREEKAVLAWREERRRLPLSPASSHDLIWDAMVSQRFTAVTDEAQLSPLSAGGLWPLLPKGGPELEEDHRAKHRWGTAGADSDVK